MPGKTIRVARDFTPFPGGRYRVDGQFSGEQFREDVLIPALREYDTVTVILDGTAGYPSSFLEEAFGGLIRNGFSRVDLSGKLEILAEDQRYETYCQLAQKYIRDATTDVAAAH